jgi:hypothetical protein
LRGVCRWEGCLWSGGSGQGQFAERGEDVAGLPDDRADLAEGGALAVLAVFHRSVVAVVGGGGAV